MTTSTLKIPCLGYELEADYYDNGGDKILLSLIGWTSNKGRYNDILTGICRRTGYDAFVFDYSGHGNSKMELDKTRPAQHFLEVVYMYDWLRQKHPDKEICVMGASYGGYMAANLSQWRDFDCLVLRAPAIYKPEDFYSLAPDLRGEALDNYRSYAEKIKTHPIYQQAKNFKGRALVVVHENDELIPTTVTDAYIDGFNADVYLAVGLGHSFGDNPDRAKIEKYQEAISDWLKQ